MGVLTVNKTYADGQVLGEANLDNAFQSIEDFVNNGLISGDNIQDNSIGPAEIQTSAVTTSKLAASAVSTAKIADLAVTQPKLAAALQAFLTPTGRITAFAGDVAPSGWLMCDGLPVSRTTYAPLFALVGVRFGQGDGTTTFNVPDLRGRFLRGRNSGALSSVQKTGSGSASGNQATFAYHGYATGQEVQLVSGSLTGLATATTYYVYNAGLNTLGFATSLANAQSATLISISGTNAAVIASLRDPEALQRTAMNTGGATGDAVGTVQLDDWKWTEGILGANSGTSGSSANGTGNPAFPQPSLALNNADATKLGLETRPVNAGVNFMIKV
jgi:microcystin-dependent protein